jgi:hypothetical protein
LADVVEEIVHLPLHDLGRDHKHLSLNLACLLRRQDVARLESKLKRLLAREQEYNVTLTWSGPWPAYSFVGSIFSSSSGPGS